MVVTHKLVAGPQLVQAGRSILVLWKRVCSDAHANPPRVPGLQAHSAWNWGQQTLDSAAGTLALGVTCHCREGKEAIEACGLGHLVSVLSDHVKVSKCIFRGPRENSKG